LLHTSVDTSSHASIVHVSRV